MKEYTLWPIYFDSDLTQSEGREVSMNAAVESPTVDEIAEAVKQVGYNAVINRDASHPSEHETRGNVVVKSSDSKNDIIHATAAYLELLRE